MLFTITITISISNKLWIEIGVDPLQNEDQHQSLSRAYDEIIEDRELVTVTTRAAFVKCVENILTNYKTVNAVTSANPGLM